MASCIALSNLKWHPEVSGDNKSNAHGHRSEIVDPAAADPTTCSPARNSRPRRRQAWQALRLRLSHEAHSAQRSQAWAAMLRTTFRILPSLWSWCMELQNTYVQPAQSWRRFLCRHSRAGEGWMLLMSLGVVTRRCSHANEHSSLDANERRSGM